MKNLYVIFAIFTAFQALNLHAAAAPAALTPAEEAQLKRTGPIGSYKETCSRCKWNDAKQELTCECKVSKARQTLMELLYPTLDKDVTNSARYMPSKHGNCWKVKNDNGDLLPEC